MFKENNNAQDYTHGEEHRFVTESDSPQVSTSVSDGGTGLDLDFHHNDTESLSEEDIKHLEEMQEHFSDEEPELSEEELLNQELERLTQSADQRKQEFMKKQRIRELRKEVRRAKLRERTAPLSDNISRLRDLINRDGSEQVSFGSSNPGFSLGEHKLDMTLGRNTGSSIQSEHGVSLSLNEGRNNLLLGGQSNRLSLGFGNHGVSWDSKKKPVLSLGSKKSAMSLDSMMGSNIDFFGQKKTKRKSSKKSKKKSNKNSLDINLIIKR